MSQKNSLIEENFRLTDRQKKALAKIGLKTLNDLLFYFPSRYEQFSERKNIINLNEGDKTTVFGTVLETSLGKTWKKRMPMAEISIGDNTGIINAVWFHQAYMAKMLNTGDKVALTGKISLGKSGLYMSNPNLEKINSYEALGEGAMILPVYPETAGITSRWIRFAVQKILKSLPGKLTMPGLPKRATVAGQLFPGDPVPEEILNKYHLPSLNSSLIFIHRPQKLSDAEAARKRFAFEEIFFIQLARLKQRVRREKEYSEKIAVDQAELEKFLSGFPFELTGAQKNAVSAIAQDMQGEHPMSRLLEGDVGSGKTAVAIAAVYMAIMNNCQAAYMAPTEILAQQHFQSFIKYFSDLKFAPKIGLITSSECRKFPSKINPNSSTHIAKSQMLRWVESGEVPILIGTHSLIQKTVKFKNLALVIIDEQHRFGVKQRAALAANKAKTAPHLLSMTATPIPRTLALTIYGDLDLSLLDEMPHGRKPIITKIVHPKERASAYDLVRQEINAGRQAYVICPRIEEADEEKLNALNVKAVTEEAKRLKKEVFPEFEISILHGKMLPKEKEEALADFKNNKIQILVATSVIEVGIDAPNATVIIIEGAERFGLAQLHQLRGRVIRGNHQPHCLVFTESHSQKTAERLKAFVTAKNGFELAEYDLQLRGSGELGGGKQWGVSDVGMEALKNIKMVEAARTEAQKLVKEDLEFKKHPLILEKLTGGDKQIHFE